MIIYIYIYILQLRMLLNNIILSQHPNNPGQTSLSIPACPEKRGMGFQAHSLMHGDVLFAWRFRNIGI